MKVSLKTTTFPHDLHHTSSHPQLNIFILTARTNLSSPPPSPSSPPSLRLYLSVSSDTESAAGARGRLAALTARVRAALPKKNEKHNEQAAEEASEEKKGVVYAELALGEQAGDRPPPPATEYAEIVYTQEQEKEGEK
ncbi:unnamed protein product [Danaus chrysippus]|uniref:(African queen) hypothetical protein n=1 Tax=Danaus chrysippus TaxID=151541 RepID=A0A8J2R1E3_9NEOP|nr:unnamed protein product [Danaus chrysippus]